tara:strand:- start:956 stop:1696 length:741 start_codon:yes stop_codon:yes gene_type:complete
MITVILNAYKRTDYLKEQIEAVRNQSIPPEDIWIWYNKPEDREQIELDAPGCKLVQCNHNFKFHGRFALGLLAQTPYVAFFDDDTIPSPRWFESCMKTIDQGHDGILGGIGVVLEGDAYAPNHKVGWDFPNEQVEEVDLVGHAWFMNKNYLRYLWYEEPLSWDNGEDMQLSYLAQKHGGIKTYVPAHSVNDTSWWSNNPATATKYANDENANGVHVPSHFPLRQKIAHTYIAAGEWKTVLTRKAAK